MPAAPTPWAGLPLPAEGDLPDVPADVARLANSVDAFLKLMLTSGPTSSTPAPTTGQNLLNINSQLAGLTSTVSTLTNQVSALQAQVAALQQTPSAYTAQYNGPQINLDRNSSSPIPVLSLTVPAAAYRRVFLAFASSTWEWWDENPNNPANQEAPFLTRFRMNGADRNQCLNAGGDVTNNNFFVETVEAGVQSTVSLTVESSESWEVPPGLGGFNSWWPPRIYVVTLPWSGAIVPPPS